MRKLRVGVIGVGYFGQFHVEKYHRLPEVELVGVADINPSRSRQIARRFNTEDYRNYEDLYDKVDAVSIAVPTLIHYQVTKNFFQRGIDVLLEKPITTTLRQADELIAMAEERQCVFQVGHQERFNAVIMALEGSLVDPLFIESHRLSPFLQRAAGVDVVLDLMIHDIQVILSMVNSSIQSIQAAGASIVSPYLDIANARIEFKNGCIANVTASRVSREKVRKIRIFQSTAYFSIDYVSQKMSVLSGDGEGRAPLSPGVFAEDIEIAKNDPLELEIKSFVERVRDRKRPLVSGLDGKNALEVALIITDQIHRNIEKRKKLGGSMG
ncbi:MAG: Gfo/Idh/MocA family oxidoreductase [Syntrophobacterales bacterium]|nr:MAG: Gfo/Idh/MocA family oxidoreductase [Syntrophobacterales bacterium]